MKIIVGETESGKSSLALELVKKAPKSIYFSLDNDKSLKNKVDSIKCDVDVKFIENPFMIDIEMEIIQNGGLKNNITHIVVDTINFIKSADVYDDKKVNHIKNIISGLEYIELTYNVKVIAVFTSLKMIDNSKKEIMEYGKKHSIIKTSKKKIKKD